MWARQELPCLDASVVTRLQLSQRNSGGFRRFDRLTRWRGNWPDGQRRRPLGLFLNHRRNRPGLRKPRDGPPEAAGRELRCLRWGLWLQNGATGVSSWAVAGGFECVCFSEFSQAGSVAAWARALCSSAASATLRCGWSRSRRRTNARRCGHFKSFFA